MNTEVVVVDQDQILKAARALGILRNLHTEKARINKLLIEGETSVSKLYDDRRDVTSEILRAEKELHTALGLPE